MTGGRNGRGNPFHITNRYGRKYCHTCFILYSQPDFVFKKPELISGYVHMGENLTLYNI